MLDLNKLNHFVTIVRANSYSGAAEELKVGQSSLTRSIAALEEEFGTRLLERARGRNGVVPTEAGYALLERAQELLRLSQNTIKEVSEIESNPHQRLHFGLGSLLGTYLLEQLPTAFLGPQKVVQIEILPHDTLMERLLSGSLDFYVGLPASEGVPPSVHAQLVGVGAPKMLVRRDHPLALKQGPIDPKEILAYPRIAGSQWNRAVADTAPDEFNRMLLTASLQVDYFDALTEYAYSGDAIVLSAFEPKRANLVPIDIQLEFKVGVTQLYLFSIRGVEQNALGKAAIQWIESRFADLEPI